MAGLNKYQAYPEYRDSGVEWLGEIPSSWDIWKISHAYEVIGSGTTPTSNNESWFNGNIPWVTTGELRETVIYKTSKNLSLSTLISFPALKVHPVGSIIIAMYGATIGRLGILGIDATTNQACCVMTKSNVINNKYLYYWLQAFRVDILNLSSGGGQPNINQEKVSSLKISSPSIKHQILIAEFLDYETTKIDTLIEKQQQLIELLKEKRQAVISHAVTKGLNPDVPMKDSGIEWLEEIPNNWITMKLKFITTLKSEKIVSPHTRYVGLENISSGDGNFIVTTDITPESTSLFFEKEDILFGKLRPYLAKAWLATFSGVCSSEFLVLKVEKLHPKYLNYFILSEKFIKQVDSSTYGTKMPRANWEDIGQLPIPLCSYEESKKIAMYLDKLTANLDILKEQQFRQIELLKERRTALISAAVTGKIDLRNWAAPIPEAETPTEASA